MLISKKNKTFQCGKKTVSRLDSLRPPNKPLPSARHAQGKDSSAGLLHSSIVLCLRQASSKITRSAQLTNPGIRNGQRPAPANRLARSRSRLTRLPAKSHNSTKKYCNVHQIKLAEVTWISRLSQVNPEV